MLDERASDWANIALETQQPFAATGDIVLGEGLRGHSGFRRATTSGQATIWRVRDATLLPMLGAVLKDGRILEQTRYCSIPGEEARARASLAGPRGRLDGRRGFVALNRVCSNYYHVLTQILPAIASYAALPGFADGVLLLGSLGPVIPPGTPPGTHVLPRAWTLAGIRPPAIAMPPHTRPLDVPDLTFSSLLTGGIGPSAFCRALYAGMAERAEALAPDPGRRHPAAIYVARLDGRARPLRGEQALIERLGRLGVAPVVLSALGLDEQIMLFRHARLVVGPHGAGLANIVFARPGTVLYEVMPRHYINPAINHLAQQHGAHYWADTHQPDDCPGVWRHQVTWTVDLDAVERRVVEIMRAYRIS